MTAGAACSSCGTGLRENAKFCDECGAPTSVSADTPEYKQVTVLFADVVRSMDIAAAWVRSGCARSWPRWWVAARVRPGLAQGPRRARGSRGHHAQLPQERSHPD